MNNRQESKLSMFLAVGDFMVSNSVVLMGLPNFAVNETAFKGAVGQIQVNSTLQGFDKRGIAVHKGVSKRALIRLAVDTARKVSAFAKMMNNEELLAEVNYSESEFLRFADTALRDAVQGVYDRAQSNLEALADYGVNDGTQTALEGAISAYNVEIPKPRIGITERRQATLILASLFKLADGALANIDALVEIVRVSQPNFYNGYRGTRRLVMTGMGSVAVKGRATDAATGIPLQGVRLEFSLDGTLVLTKKTAAKGGYIVKSLGEGSYILKASKPGYKDVDSMLFLSNGEMKELNVAMEGV